MLLEKFHAKNQLSENWTTVLSPWWARTQVQQQRRSYCGIDADGVCPDRSPETRTCRRWGVRLRQGVGRVSGAGCRGPGYYSRPRPPTLSSHALQCQAPQPQTSAHRVMVTNPDNSPSVIHYIWPIFSHLFAGIVSNGVSWQKTWWFLRKQNK